MKYILFFLLIPVSLEIQAQDLALTWARQLAGPENTSPNSMVTDGSGSYISCGSFNGVIDLDPGPLSNIVSSNGGKDGYIVKLNSLGNFVWGISFGNTNEDIAFDVAVDNQGNVYCTGEFSGTVNFDIIGVNGSITAQGSGNPTNAFVVKYNNAGQFQWVKKFGGTSLNTQSGRAVAINAVGDVVTCGVSGSDADFDPSAGTATVNFFGNNGLYISTLSGSGQFVSVAGMPAPGYLSFPTDLECDAQSNVYMAGQFGSTVDFNPGPGTYNLTSSSISGFVVAIDAGGSFIYAKDFSSSYTCAVYDIVRDVEGNTFLSGDYSGTTDFDPDLANSANLINNNSQQPRPFLVKLNSDTSFGFVSDLGVGGGGRASQIRFDNDGIIYIGGFFRGETDLDPDPLGEFLVNSSSDYNEDCFITRLDSNGNFIDANAFGSSQNDRINNIAVNAITKVITVSGHFSNAMSIDGNTTLTSAGQTDAFFARFTNCFPSEATVEESNCGPMFYNDQYLNASGTYSFGLTNEAGCDSLLTLNFTLLMPTYSNVELSTTSPITYNDITYNEGGTYTQVFTNSVGCDSIVQVDVVFLVDGFALEGNGTTISGGGTPPGIAYQWVDCNNNFALIPGATNTTFSPTQSGSFAMIVYGNQGSVMSECYDFIYIGLNEIMTQVPFFVSPNPCFNEVTISASRSGLLRMSLFDINGQLIEKYLINGPNTILSLEHLPSGIYIMQMDGQSHRIVKI